MKQKLALILITISVLSAPMTTNAMKRVWLTGKHDVEAGCGVKYSQCDGPATGYKLNKDISNGVVYCVGKDELCFEVGFDCFDGWYADINMLINSWLPPFDPKDNIYEFRIPQTSDEELKVELIYKGHSTKDDE